MEVELQAVGANLADLRSARGLSLRDLADLTGYTASYLSQIERGESVPSLSGLASVSVALGVEMATLFERAAGPRVHISRKDDPLELRTPESDDEPAHRYEVIGAHGSDRAYTALIHRLPSLDSGVVYRHFGERFCLVLDGEVEITIGGDSHHITAGNSIHYASHEAHTFRAFGETDATVLWIVSPAIF